MIFFDKVNLVLDGLLIPAESFSFSSKASLSENRFLGQKGLINLSQSSPVSNQVSFTYSPSVHSTSPYSDQIIDWSKNIKNGNSPPPLELKVAGFSGMFYLNTVSLSLQNGSELKSSVLLSCYTEISGALSEDTIFSNNVNKLSLGHGYTSYLYKGDEIKNSNINVFDINYNFLADYNTVYKIGSQYPEIQPKSFKENISFEIDSVKLMKETGLAYDEIINADGIAFKSLDSSLTRSILLSGFVIDEATFSIAKNDIIRGSISMSKEENV